MDKVVSIIGIDISKSCFHLHGATASGEPVLRKRLTRGNLLAFLSRQPICRIVMEACGGAHHWGLKLLPSLPISVRHLVPLGLLKGAEVDGDGRGERYDDWYGCGRLGPGGRGA